MKIKLWSKHSKAVWKQFGIVLGLAAITPLTDFMLRIERGMSASEVLSAWMVVPVIVGIVINVLINQLKTPQEKGREAAALSPEE